LADSNNRIGLIENDPNAKDDVVVIGPEFYLLENQNYKFTINSWDVLHGAYFPSLRMSMNAVPGMETYLPIQTKAATAIQDSLTSSNMLVCIKICGAGHPNMKMKFKVAAEKDYWNWLDRIQ
jgi:heme/copper-type cytochrome/quinol oxidase subunit 2